MLSHSVVSDSATPLTAAGQAPLSMRVLQVRILEWVAMPSSRGIFPTQGLNPGLPHGRWILYQVSRKGNTSKFVIFNYRVCQLSLAQLCS